MKGDPNRRRSNWRRVGLCALAIVCLLVVVAGWLWWFVAAAPAWWADAGRLAPDAVQRAEALERGLTRVLHEPRAPGERWSVSLSEADANAWFAERFTKWAANRGAPWAEALRDGRVSPPRILFAPGSLSVGCVTSQGWGKRVISVTFRPVLATGDDGAERLFISDGRVSMGRLAVDADAVSGLIERFDSGRAAGSPGPDVSGFLSGRLPLVSPADFSLDDGRSVRLLAVTVEEGRLILEAMNR